MFLRVGHLASLSQNAEKIERLLLTFGNGRLMDKDVFGDHFISLGAAQQEEALNALVDTVRVIRLIMEVPVLGQEE